MNAIRRTLTLAAGLALALSLGGCGDGKKPCSENPTGPGCAQSPPPTTLAAPQPIVLDRGEGQLPALVGLFRTLAATQSGAFDVTVDWTFAKNDIDIFLARGECSFEQFVNERCTVLAVADSSTAKPEKLRLANQPAGTYTVVIVNFGPDDESIAYQVVFTPGTAAAAASSGSADRRLDKGTHRLRGTVDVY